MNQIEQNQSLKPFSTFRIGGPADYLMVVQNRQDLRNALDFIKGNELRFLVLGGGSNVLFSDLGYSGFVIKMENNRIKETSAGIFEVESGTTNAELFAYAKQRGYDFSPFLTIPGTIGGAVAGNAGIPGHEIFDLLLSVTIFDTEQMRFRIMNTDRFHASYRHTVYHDDPQLKNRWIIWSARIQLPAGSEAVIDKQAKDYVRVRKEKQPWGKTGGSFFKNPAESPAGLLLDKAGFKGRRFGDAFFSEKHANFMMNAGNASQFEIIKLAKMAMADVKEQFGVKLLPEVRILDEFGKQVRIGE